MTVFEAGAMMIFEARAMTVFEAGAMTVFEARAMTAWDDRGPHRACRHDEQTNPGHSQATTGRGQDSDSRQPEHRLIHRRITAHHHPLATEHDAAGRDQKQKRISASPDAKQRGDCHDHRGQDATAQVAPARRPIGRPVGRGVRRRVGMRVSQGEPRNAAPASRIPPARRRNVPRRSRAITRPGKPTRRRPPATTGNSTAAVPPTSE